MVSRKVQGRMVRNRGKNTRNRTSGSQTKKWLTLPITSQNHASQFMTRVLVPISVAQTDMQKSKP